MVEAKHAARANRAAARPSEGHQGSWRHGGHHLHQQFSNHPSLLIQFCREARSYAVPARGAMDDSALSSALLRCVCSLVEVFSQLQREVAKVVGDLQLASQVVKDESVGHQIQPNWGSDPHETRSAHTRPPAFVPPWSQPLRHPTNGKPSTIQGQHGHGASAARQPLPPLPPTRRRGPPDDDPWSRRVAQRTESRATHCT